MGWKPDYITADELAAFLTIADHVDDDELADAISMASRAIDRNCHRQFGKVAAAESRRYTAWWNSAQCRWVVDIDDLFDITGFTAELVDAGGAIDSYDLEPVNAAQEGLPYTRFSVKPDSTTQPTGAEFEVMATAPWGWLAYPRAVVYAAKLQSSRFFARRNSPYGIAGSPEQGSELRLLSKLDPDVAVGLADLVRPSWGA